MALDFASNVKSLAMGITQYQSNMSENNLSHLLRHIDVLLGGLKLRDTQRLFNSRSVLGSQCITNIVELLTEPGTDSHLLSKVIELLNTLAKVAVVCDHLQSSFSISSILCGYIIQHKSQERYSHIIPQILLLLGRITYKRQVSSTIAHLNQILGYLLNELENNEGDTVLPCLRILNNLVSSNLSIQVQVKSMLTSKRTKNMMQFLKQGATQQSILALSILTAIFWGDDIGKKLYHGQNWFKAMKIIFSTLFADGNTEAQSTAGDLCIELLRHKEISQQIVLYEEEHSCTIKLFDLLQGESQASSKILEVILAFCHVGLVRSSICHRVLKDGMKNWEILLSSAESERNDLTLPVELTPSLLALDLVREICEEVVESAQQPTDEWISNLLAVVYAPLSHISDDDHSQLKFRLYRIYKSIQILHCLSSEDDDILATIGETLKGELIYGILEHQMTHNLTGIVSAQPEWSEIGIDVVLSILELMLKIKQYVPGLEKMLFRVLQDTRLVPFYVSALTSTKSSKVQTALRLYQEASTLPDFPFILLGEKMAEHNGKNEKATLINPNFVHTEIRVGEVQTPRSNFDRPNAIWNDMRQNSILEGVSVASVASSSSSEDKENFDALIHKMQGTLKMDKKLSGKTAQIMEMYEQKIASLQTKESHLQDLLDAKALALSQADRVIARNRCQQVQSEEESRRLSHLLQESEMKCEQLLQEIQNVESNRQDIEKELVSTVEENRNLQKIADQYDSLQAAFNDKKHRIEVQERNLASLVQEYDTLKEMHDMFQKHNEKLKIQVNEGVRRLEHLEEEKLKLLKDAGDKQMQIHEMEGLLMESEKVARHLLEEKSELEILHKNLQTNIQTLEEEAKNQKIKITAHERAKQQLEHQLKERGAEIKKLHQRNEGNEKKISCLYSEKQSLAEEVESREKDIKKLHNKLEEQKQTFLKITELSAALQSSSQG